MSHLLPTLSHGQRHTGASTHPPTHTHTHTHTDTHIHTYKHTHRGIQKASMCLKATGDRDNGVIQNSPAASFNVPLSSTAHYCAAYIKRESCTL